MAHKVLVDGTAYEITGGKTLIDGTAYSIKNGKTLVDGTAYEIGFAKEVTITLSNSGNQGSCYIMCNGHYYSHTLTPSFTANIGDIIYCNVNDSEKNRVYVNNAQVFSKSGESGGVYEYTVVSDATISFYPYKPDESYIYIFEHSNITYTGNGLDTAIDGSTMQAYALDENGFFVAYGDLNANGVSECLAPDTVRTFVISTIGTYGIYLNGSEVSYGDSVSGEGILAYDYTVPYGMRVEVLFDCWTDWGVPQEYCRIYITETDI